MLRPLPDLPAGVIGFEAVGEIHADDYRDVLRPAVDAAAAGGGVRLVYVLGGEFTGYSAGASWEDAKLGLGHLEAWRRLAVVSDHEWVGHMVGAVGWLIPGDVRTFALADRAAAARWASGAEPEPEVAPVTPPVEPTTVEAPQEGPAEETAATATAEPLPTSGIGNAQTLTPTAPLGPGAYVRPGMATAVPAPAEPSVPAQWAPDPMGRHQYRWWDGGQWTPHVADNGQAGFDPIG